MAQNEKPRQRYIWKTVTLTPVGSAEKRQQDIERIKWEIRSLKRQLRELKHMPLPETDYQMVECKPDDPDYDSAAFEVGLVGFDHASTSRR